MNVEKYDFKQFWLDNEKVLWAEVKQIAVKDLKVVEVNDSMETSGDSDSDGDQ
jgi:hypothetical protein